MATRTMTDEAAMSATRALLVEYAAGAITVPTLACDYQRKRIDAELREAGTLLTNPSVRDEAWAVQYAALVTANIRAGLLTGALVAAPQRAARVAHLLEFLANSRVTTDTPPSVWFDAPEVWADGPAQLEPRQLPANQRLS
ncbi:MAG TPA: hypothetical protein VFQ95_00220 [Rhodanobacteraceae bacterium]|nr:hypothetical protein [Rhodanobacteraceae bacterium]